MELLYDMPIGLGEPHDVVSIHASKIKPKKLTTKWGQIVEQVMLTKV